MDETASKSSRVKEFLCNNADRIAFATLGAATGLVGKACEIPSLPIVTGATVLVASEATLSTPTLEESKQSLKRRLSNYAAYTAGVVITNADRIYHAVNTLGDFF